MTLSLGLVLFIASAIIFYVAAWLGKSLLAVGLGTLTLALALATGVVKL